MTKLPVTFYASPEGIQPYYPKIDVDFSPRNISDDYAYYTQHLLPCCRNVGMVFFSFVMK